MADQTVSTNYEPWLQIPYQYLVNTALGQAQQPYQAYGGQGVAPMTQQQLQAIQGVGGYNILPTLENWMTQTQNAGNISSASQAAPWFQGAAGSLGGAGTSLGSGAMALGQSGNALGAASNTINSFSAAAPWLNNAGSNLAGVGAISGQGAANPYALMATSSPGALQAASPYLQQASQSGVGGISSYLNPYNTAVNDALAQQSARNVSENLLPKVNSTFTGAGQFGSSRNADITGRVLRDANESLLNQQSANLQSGFNTAANLSQQDLARQAGLAATAGGLQGTDLSRYLGAGQLALSGATTDINKGLGISGQLGSLGQTAGNMANIDAQRQLGIAQGYQGISQGQQGIAQGWGNIANAQAGIGNSMGNLTNVDANRLLSAAAQGTNQGLAQQGVYNQGIDRLYGYGSALQGQNQNENAWNYNQWQQQQQYPWDQLNNLSAILGGARPGGTVQSSSGGSGSNLNSILGAGLGLIAAKPWSWFADGGRVPGYANGGITNALDSLADTFESPLMQAALSLVGSKGSRTGDAVGSAIQAAAKANTNADAKKLRKMQMDLLKARIPTPQSALAPGRSSAGGSGVMQGVRPYWDEYEAVGYADGGAVDDEEGGILSAFSRAGNWLDRVTGGTGIEAGPLDKRYAELVGGNLPERPAINSPLMQAAAALLTSKQKRPLAAIGEGLSALTQGSENQRKLALGEQALKAQILGALQKENDPSKRYKEVNGQLVDLAAPGGPKPVGQQIRPLSATPWDVQQTPDGAFAAAPGATEVLGQRSLAEKGAWVPAVGPGGIPGQRNTLSGEWKQADTRPVTNVQTNVTQTGEKKGSEVMYSQAAQGFQGAQDAARTATRKAPVYDRMLQAAEAFTPGATAEMRLTAGKYLKDFGINAVDNIPEGEVLQQLGQQLAITAAPTGQGAVSNYERELYQKAVPTMAKTREGLKEAVDIARALDRYDLEVARVYRDNAKKNGGIPDPVTVAEQIADLPQPITEAQRVRLEKAIKSDAITAPAPPKPGGIPKIANRDEWEKLPKGTKYLDPDGKERIKR